VTLLEEQVADINERLTAQESHFEGLRAAILELRRDLSSRYSTREADILALRQRIEDLEKTFANGLAEVHRSLQLLLDRRDVALLQRSVNETMRRVQALEEGQKELREGQQELGAGQQQIRQVLQEILAKLG
jgi:predicted  nucleic acid-binding Zn-ribbon protein